MPEKKILVIDDEPDVLKVLKFRLEKAGYRVITALDGIKGMELAVQEKPDLVILDIMMPGGDGYSLCEKMKTISATACLPVIFLSAKAEPRDIAKGYEKGALFYITKPYDPEALLEKVKKALESPQELEDERKRGLKKLLIFTQDNLLKGTIRDNFLGMVEPTFVERITDFNSLPLDKFDILILDLVMEGIDLRRLIQENREKFREGVRFILITGPYWVNLEEIKAMLPFPFILLRRPFMVDELRYYLR